MIVTGSAAHGQDRRRQLRLDDGFEYFKGEWLESGREPALSPTMFLIEQGPHSRLGIHFHRENEFQVVVKGGGVFGSHAVEAITVHYAGAYTGYGPIIAGDDGLWYFTIRAVFEQGAVMLPQGREQMLRGPKRQLHSPSYPAAADADLAARTEAQVVDLFGPQPDGVAAVRFLLPPGATATAPDGAGSAGQYVMCVAGSLLHGGRAFGRWEPIFASADEAPLPLHAGPGGADVLYLRLPPKAPDYQAPTGA